MLEHIVTSSYKRLIDLVTMPILPSAILTTHESSHYKNVFIPAIQCQRLSSIDTRLVVVGPHSARHYISGSPHPKQSVLTNDDSFVINIHDNDEMWHRLHPEFQRHDQSIDHGGKSNLGVLGYIKEEVEASYVDTVLSGSSKTNAAISSPKLEQHSTFDGVTLAAGLLTDSGQTEYLTGEKAAKANENNNADTEDASASCKKAVESKLSISGSRHSHSQSSQPAVVPAPAHIVSQVMAIAGDNPVTTGFSRGSSVWSLSHRPTTMMGSHASFNLRHSISPAVGGNPWHRQSSMNQHHATSHDDFSLKRKQDSKQILPGEDGVSKDIFTDKNRRMVSALHTDIGHSLESRRRQSSLAKPMPLQSNLHPVTEVTPLYEIFSVGGFAASVNTIRAESQHYPANSLEARSHHYPITSAEIESQHQHHPVTAVEDESRHSQETHQQAKSILGSSRRSSKETEAFFPAESSPNFSEESVGIKKLQAALKKDIMLENLRASGGEDVNHRKISSENEMRDIEKGRTSRLGSFDARWNFPFRLTARSPRISLADLKMVDEQKQRKNWNVLQRSFCRKVEPQTDFRQPRIMGTPRVSIMNIDTRARDTSDNRIAIADKLEQLRWNSKSSLVGPHADHAILMTVAAAEGMAGPFKNKHVRVRDSPTHRTQYSQTDPVNFDLSSRTKVMNPRNSHSYELLKASAPSPPALFTKGIQTNLSGVPKLAPKNKSDDEILDAMQAYPRLRDKRMSYPFDQKNLVSSLRSSALKSSDGPRRSISFRTNSNTKAGTSPLRPIFSEIGISESAALRRRKSTSPTPIFNDDSDLDSLLQLDTSSGGFSKSDKKRKPRVDVRVIDTGTGDWNSFTWGLNTLKTLKYSPITSCIGIDESMFTN